MVQGIEEGLLRHPLHLGHRDRSPLRLAVVGGIWVLGTWLIWSADYATIVSIVLQFVVVLVGLGAGVLMHRHARKKHNAERAAFERERRLEHAKETARSIKDAKSSGAFSRWQKQ